jgi:hypothetical protein
LSIIGSNPAPSPGRSSIQIFQEQSPRCFRPKWHCLGPMELGPLELYCPSRISLLGLNSLIRI